MKIFLLVRKNNNSLVNYFTRLTDATGYIKAVGNISDYKVVETEGGETIKETSVCKLATRLGYDTSDW